MKHVLVVDDERDVADALAELLSDSFRVTCVYDGAQALRLLEKGGIDAVVLDLMMPVMSGEALMSELQARGLEVPVIFASAASDLGNRARRSKASDFIAKPFDFVALEQKLLRLLGSSNAGGSSSPPGEDSRGELKKSPGGQGARARRQRGESTLRA